ncbi:YcaO-like family protein [Streptomyces albulus]|nr:YcaO-like family protein [Streptomyces noursei]
MGGGDVLTTGRPRYVPACAVYLPYRFPRAHKPWFDPISTGLAAGGSYHHAVLGGLMESVERDATLVFWENRLTLPGLDLTGLPDGPARRIVDRITAEGATVTCKDLTTDLGIPAVAVRFAGAPPSGRSWCTPRAPTSTRTPRCWARWRRRACAGPAPASGSKRAKCRRPTPR